MERLIDAGCRRDLHRPDRTRSRTPLVEQRTRGPAIRSAVTQSPSRRPLRAADRAAGARRRRGRAAWALWDCGSSAYSTIVVSFVFAPYLTDAVGGPDAALGLVRRDLARHLDRRGRCADRRAWPRSPANAPTPAAAAAAAWRICTGPGHRSARSACSSCGTQSSYLWLGLVLMAAGSVFMEFAYVSYNAMLHQISTPRTIGRISGLGWGSGYVGGIVVLLAAYVLFIAPEVGLFGVTDAERAALPGARPGGRGLVRGVGDPGAARRAGGAAQPRPSRIGFLASYRS